MPLWGMTRTATCQRDALQRYSAEEGEGVWVGVKLQHKHTEED